MNEERQYVRVDEPGVMRIGNSRVMLDSIVAGFEQGHSPETLQQQYPTLSLEEVYGAITYYLAHPDEVAPIKRQHCSTGCRRERQYRCISDALAHLAGLVWGQDVVAQRTQSLDHGVTEILVCVQPGHCLCFLSVFDGLLNLLTMGVIICPSGFQIRPG